MVFYLFFFFSGATALVYEVIWARILQLTFGSTVYAITTVLTAFMAGLSLGSYFMGRIAEKKKNPLLLYGLMECGIAIYALLTPFLLELTDKLYLSYYHTIWQQQQLLFIVRFLHSFVVLLIPTIFMGATLPVLSKYLISRFENFGRTLSLLYAINTFGAMIGTAFVGFYALPAIGMIQSNYIAASLNLIIGIVSIFLWNIFKAQDRIIQESSTEPAAQPITHDEKESPLATAKTKHMLLYIKILLLVSGYAAMAYELLWTRTLELFINSTTYSFSIILVIYLLGIALGSLINSVVLKGRFNNIQHLAILQLIIGGSVFICFPLFAYIPRLVLLAWQVAPASYAWNDFAKMLCCMIIMLIPTICMGMTFPIGAEIYSSFRRRISQDIGTAYAFTTWGNILGSFITGVFMIAWLGIQTNMKICIIMNVLLAIAGIILFYEKRVKLTYAVVLIATLIVLLVIVYPPWSPYMLDSGVFMYQQRYKVSSLFEEMAKEWKITYYKEGLNTLITVRSSGDSIMMRMNGKTDASTIFPDMHNQLMAGYLVLLQKPEAKNSLIIGLGSGVTAGVIIQSPNLTRVDCIEIESSVLEAANYFKYYNRDFINDKRVHIYIEDGKSFLKSTKNKYDIISLHLSNPWIPGIANLYTEEAYELMKSRLNDNGILLQWFQTYRVSPAIIKMVVRTYAKVFPYYQVWTDGPAIFMVASRHPLKKYDEKFFALVEHIPNIKSDFKNYFGIEDGKALMAFYIADNEKFNEFFGEGDIHTDNKPLLDFMLPKVFFYDYLENWNYMSLLQFRDKEDWLQKHFQWGTNAYDYYILASAKNVQGLSNEALQFIEQGLLINDRAPYLLALKGYILGPQNPAGGVDLFEKTLNQDPGIAKIHYLYAILLMNKYSPESAVKEYKKAEELGYSDKPFWLDYANALMKNAHYHEALAVLQKGIPSSEDWKYKYYEQMGVAYAGYRNYQEALNYYKKATEDNPYYSPPFAKAAEIYDRVGIYNKAEELYQIAITIEPSRNSYYLKLATIKKKLGKTREAYEAIQKAYLLSEDKIEVYTHASSIGIIFP